MEVFINEFMEYAEALLSVVSSFLIGHASNLMAVGVGALITWFASSYYYKKAADGLNKEAKDLKRLSNLITRGLEEGGLAKFVRDENGQATGMHLEVNIVERLSVSSRFQATPSPGDSEN